MRIKDSRINTISEVLTGIKVCYFQRTTYSIDKPLISEISGLSLLQVIKLYAWENPLMKKIRNIRVQELSYLKKIAYFNSCVSFTFVSSPFIVSKVQLIKDRHLTPPQSS